MLKIRQTSFPDVELVVAIARGGILPGYLVSRFLNLGLEILYLHFRDERHQKEFAQPQLEKMITFDSREKRILLVDDVSNSGATFAKAKELLDTPHVFTAVISGKADISFYGSHTKCIQWPWD